MGVCYYDCTAGADILLANAASLLLCFSSSPLQNEQPVSVRRRGEFDGRIRCMAARGRPLAGSRVKPLARDATAQRC